MAALTVALAGTSAAAHDVQSALQGSGHVRVVFDYSDGTPMAGAAFRVFAPGEGHVPSAKGLTDTAGGVEFRAATDGQWRVDARDSNGHASRARIDVAKGVPSLAVHLIPDWLANASVSVNLALAVWFLFGRRWARAASRQDAAARPKAPHQHGTIAS